jgi:hypothetical protein
MIDNIWFCEPNDARESWCFFSMKSKEIDSHQCIIEWEAIYANPSKVTYKAKNTPSAEETLLREILFHVSMCRKKEIPIITYERKIIPILRSRLLFHGMCNISLRNLKTLSLQDLLQDYFYFGTTNSFLSASDFARELKIDENGLSETELCYVIFKRMGPLLPLGVIE